MQIWQSMQVLHYTRDHREVEFELNYKKKKVKYFYMVDILKVWCQTNQYPKGGPKPGKQNDKHENKSSQSKTK